MLRATIIETPESLQPIIDLLKASKLPSDDIQLKDNLFVAYRDSNGNLAGSGALEFYDSYALLRSVAVQPAFIGKAYGKEIVSDLLSRAKNLKIREVYLLTETARDFFSKRGFVEVMRDAAPDSIHGSTEFKSVCPISAVCMVYRF